MSRTVVAASISLCVLLSACGGKPQLASVDGELAPCQAARCVSSLSRDPDYRIEPIAYEGSRESARLALLRIITAMPGTRIALQTEDYIHVEFTSPVMRYRDDLELQFPRRDPVVHVRSSSRAGYYDFDNNRERVEQIRAEFNAVQP
ncbi:DUF1499 domain-containing protein [Solimonas sp. SE-A11]|uniref:DUF1499 domain-containing protein n=1 Tax=Solimonas sp. SE-A11 TaxID=3054954 RepID=UPI00259CD748|nr:DUF1499 domain-containing protein [Solimonas sp. SE-A11]MDM4770383.1 DUF1499 domain-containing protein [Solimonas sp. SE-A11]